MEKLKHYNHIIRSPAGVMAMFRIPFNQEHTQYLFTPNGLRALADEIEAFHKEFWNNPEAGVDWTEGRTPEECEGILNRFHDQAGHLIIVTQDVIEYYQKIDAAEPEVTL